MLACSVFWYNFILHLFQLFFLRFFSVSKPFCERNVLGSFTVVHMVAIPSSFVQPCSALHFEDSLSWNCVHVPPLSSVYALTFVLGQTLEHCLRTDAL